MSKYLKLAILTSLMLNGAMAMEQQQDLVQQGNNQIVKLERNQLLAACEEFGFNPGDKTTKEIETEMLGINSVNLNGDDGENKYLSLIQLIQGGYLPNLKKLEFPCDMPVAGFVNNLAQAIKVSHIKLKELCIDDNAEIVGDDGIANLLTIDLSEMEWMNFLQNGIGDAGAEQFAKAMTQNRMPNLNYVDLSYNDIGQNGAQGIVDAVIAGGRYNQFIALNLGQNNIDQQVAKELHNKIKKAVQDDQEKFQTFIGNPDNINSLLKETQEFSNFITQTVLNAEHLKTLAPIKQKLNDLSNKLEKQQTKDKNDIQTLINKAKELIGIRVQQLKDDKEQIQEVLVKAQTLNKLLENGRKFSDKFVYDIE